MDQNQTAQSAIPDSRLREIEGTDDQPQGTNDEAEASTLNPDPNDYQNYYYEEADGNFYYYPPQDMVTNELIQDTGEVPITAENLIRSYEFEDWEPRSYNWFVDIVLDIFVSLEFRLYLFFLLYCAGCLLLSLSLNWTFGILFRMHVPSSNEQFSSLPLLGFSVVFLLLSFTLVTVFCTWIDMLRGLRYVKREDIIFLGMSHYSRKRPPYIVYLVIIIATTIFPFMWGIIAAALTKQSLLFFAQSYAFISIIVTMVGILICYVWFYWCALVQKQKAYKQRMRRDEFEIWEKALRNRGNRPLEKHWYHASTFLEEFGLDGHTLRWNAIVFTVGYAPLLALYMAQAIRSYLGDPEITWGVVFSVTLTCIYVISWMTLFRVDAQWSVYASIFLIVALPIIGLICGGISTSKEVVGVVIFLFITSHGMVARKRPHVLTRKEQCALFNIPLDPEIQHEVQRRRFDSRLFCCRNAVLDCLKCFDVKTYFAYRHPEVVQAERQYALDNIAIRTDQKVLMYWWLIVMFALAFTIALGNSMVYHFTDVIAANGSPIAPQDATLPICTMRYNTNGSAPLGIYDLSLLSALSYTVATSGDQDFATWFSQFPDLVRLHPLRLPPSFDYATSGVSISFSDYTDLQSDFHFVTLNSNNRGLSVMRNVDEWGTSIAVQVAGAISPLISIWPENYRASFVFRASFLSRWFSHPEVLKDISDYIDNLIASGKQDRILLVGDQFNGGYVKILSSMFDLPFVAFNPPGTKYKLPFQAKGVQIAFTRGILSYVDSLEDTSDTIYLECNSGYSSNRCSRIETTIEVVSSLCGDPYGRRLK